MAIKLELGELYGCKDYKELMKSIEDAKALGLSDEEINKALERGKQNHNEKIQKKQTNM